MCEGNDVKFNGIKEVGREGNGPDCLYMLILLILYRQWKAIRDLLKCWIT